MAVRGSKYVAPCLLSVVLTTMACDGGRLPGATALSTAPDEVSSAQVTAQPAVVTPEFLAAALCTERPPFRARVTLLIRSGDDIFLRGLGFEFLDGSGIRTAPTVIPTSSTAAQIPTTLPVTIPSSQPIPIPGTDGLFVTPNNPLSLPFTLEFSCGVAASGTISILAQTADRNGTPSTARMSVRVRG